MIVVVFGIVLLILGLFPILRTKDLTVDVWSFMSGFIMACGFALIFIGLSKFI